ncbi:MAG: hypothetical protein B7X33_00895 [Lysobacterales bacterium 13-68-4]|nr:MAG: hypothetical protein B7X45_10635 [Xanthomonadales bacterium 15-68-25]OZB65788.1 MAG: hypothetical protein B7X39_12890 [Xanthomonadales bacterium 14-68-21]OZB72883.1 MAG: hypothetical protein B7X33_00895 [Xanthomonadales bacterium 13-68-4]
MPPAHRTVATACDRPMRRPRSATRRAGRAPRRARASGQAPPARRPAGSGPASRRAARPLAARRHPPCAARGGTYARPCSTRVNATLSRK